MTAPIIEGNDAAFVSAPHHHGAPCDLYSYKLARLKFAGEADGMENERSRLELAARATLAAIAEAEGMQGLLALDGVQRGKRMRVIIRGGAGSLATQMTPLGRNGTVEAPAALHARLSGSLPC